MMSAWSLCLGSGLNSQFPCLLPHLPPRLMSLIEPSLLGCVPSASVSSHRSSECQSSPHISCLPWPLEANVTSVHIFLQLKPRGCLTPRISSCHRPLPGLDIQVCILRIKPKLAMYLEHKDLHCMSGFGGMDSITRPVLLPK